MSCSHDSENEFFVYSPYFLFYAAWHMLSREKIFSLKPFRHGPRDGPEHLLSWNVTPCFSARE